MMESVIEVLSLSASVRRRMVGLAQAAAGVIDIRVPNRFAALLHAVYRALPGGLQPRVQFVK